MGIREGDLVILREENKYEDKIHPPGLVIKVKKREVASPHPNYRGKHPPVEVKVIHSAEVVWPGGYVSYHEVDTLERVKNRE